MSRLVCRERAAPWADGELLPGPWWLSTAFARLRRLAVALPQRADLAPEATHRPGRLVQGEEPHTPKMVMGEKSIPQSPPPPPPPPRILLYVELAQILLLSNFWGSGVL